jgi:hypothetical protein
MLPKNTSIKFATLFLSLVIFSQISCKKSDDVADNTAPNVPPVIANDAVKVAATITGSVIDENNQPVSSVTVTADTYTTSTDAMGNFTFRNINVSAANGHVTVFKAGYFKGIRSFVTSAGKNNFVKIQLIKQTVTATITAAAGGAVTSNGAVITFPVNAFVTASGAAYTGNVKVYSTWIDPTAPNLPLVVPGDLRGINSSNGEYLLKSYGMVGAELKDDNGNTLKIAPGKTAAISFPIPASLQATAPASIPLWHFDEATARWKEEGTATKNGITYTATVDKFSFWNVDAPGNFIRLDLTLINHDNSLPLNNAMVKITSLATNTYGTGFTNDSGYLSILVPKNQSLKLEVIAGTNCSGNPVVFSQTIGPYANNTSLGNIDVTATNLIIKFTGTLKNCNNQPVTNGYISLAFADGTAAIAFTNAAGVVNLNLMHCSGSMNYSFNAVDIATGSYSNTIIGIAASAAINLGAVTACGNIFNTNGVYIAGYIGNNAVLWKEGAPTLLTNQPSGFVSAIAEKTVVYNNSVYVLINDADTIKIWKDGITTKINTGTINEKASGFDVFNNDVYVCGSDLTTVPYIPKLWKNGVASILPSDTFVDVMPRAVKVINGDVYVTGWGSKANGGFKAIYWKNGVINVLTAQANKGYAHGIFSVNSDVYITGSDGVNAMDKAVYWKNGVITTLPNTGIYTKGVGQSVFIDNTDIYTAGYVGYSNAQLYYFNAAVWKNGTINLFTNYINNGDQANFSDMFVKNNTVYAVGEFSKNSTPSSPIYFQNGVAAQLQGFTANQSAGARGIFVK